MKLLRSGISVLNRNKFYINNRFYSEEKITRSGSNIAIEHNGKQSQTQIPNEVKPDRKNYNSAIESDFVSGITITAYNTYGFRLNQRIQVIGPIIVFPRTVFSWHIESVEKVNSDSLMIFEMVQPRVDTLIIGTGEGETTSHIGKNILEIAHKHKINVEVLSTQLACTQFNFLTGEGRMVAAALIPSIIARETDDDFINTLNFDNKLFKMENMDLPDLRNLKR